MSTELACLLIATLIGFAHIMIQGTLLRLDQMGKTVDQNYDTPPPQGVLTARAGRALRNFLETFPMFVALVVVAQLSGRQDTLTEVGAMTYVAARAIYIAFYLGGIPLLRSASWTVALIGMGLMVAGVVS